MKITVPRRHLFGSALIVLVVFLSPAASGFGAVTFASMFRDGAVLQQGKPVNVWGSASAGEKVTVTYQRASLVRASSTVAGPDGRWMLSLAAPPASAEPAMLVATGSSTVSINDVLVGEVWVAAGQSNMQMSFFWTARGRIEASGISKLFT